MYIRKFGIGIPGLEKGQDINPGIQNCSGLTPLIHTYVYTKTYTTYKYNCKAAILLGSHTPHTHTL
jgi:hypothetical protein